MASADQLQRNIPRLKRIPRRRAPVAARPRRGVARVARQAAKVAGIVVQVPRLVCTLGIAQQRGCAVGRGRTALGWSVRESIGATSGLLLTSTL
jgi:hypothetical protein